MTLDEFLKQHNGAWFGNSAKATIDTQEYKVAYREDGVIKLTVDGVRFKLDVTPVVAYTSASNVESQKKHGKKPMQPVADELDLGDI